MNCQHCFGEPVTWVNNMMARGGLTFVFTLILQATIGDESSSMLVLNANPPPPPPPPPIGSIVDGTEATQRVQQQYEAFPYPYRNPEHYQSTMHPARTSVISTESMSPVSRHHGHPKPILLF